MSIGRPKPNALIPPGEYQANQAKIEQAREYLNSLEEMNQTGLQRFTERERANQLQLEVMKRDLQKKVDEGIQAQLLMQELERRQSTSLPLLEGGHDSTPGSARIEEVHTTDYTRPNFSQKDRQYQSPAGNPQYPSTIYQNQSAQQQYQQPVPSYPPQWQSYQQLHTSSNIDLGGMIPPMQPQIVPPNLPSGSNKFQAAQEHIQYSKTTDAAQEPNREYLAHLASQSQPQHYVPSSSRQIRIPPDAQAPPTQVQANPKYYRKESTNPQYQRQPTTRQFQANTPPQPPFTYQPRGNIQRNTSHSQLSGQSINQPRADSPSQSISSLVGALSDDRQVQPQVQPLAGTVGTVSSPTTSTSPKISSYSRKPSTSSTAALSGIAQSGHPQVIPIANTALPPPPSIPSAGGDQEIIPHFFIPDEDVLVLRQRFKIWDRQARPGSKGELHPLIALYKDAESKTWIYVPAGNGLYFKFSNIDKFFDGQMSTARPPPTIPLMMPVSRQPVVNGAQQSTAQTVFYANPAATNAVGETTQKSTSSSSATNAGTQKPTVSPPPIPPTPTQPTIPSGLTRPLRLPSEADKKHFAKNILFALGKRSRNTSSMSEVEQPAKRHASDAAVSGRPEAIISTSSHGPDMQSNSRLDNGIVQASTSTSASISTVLDRVATPGAAIIPQVLLPSNSDKDTNLLPTLPHNSSQELSKGQTATTTKVAVIEQSSSVSYAPLPANTPVTPNISTAIPPADANSGTSASGTSNLTNSSGALDAGPSSSSSRAVDQRSSAPTIFTPVVSQPSTESADMDTSILATHSATVNKATTEPPPTPAAPALQNSSIPKVTPTTTVPETSVPSALQRSNPYAFLLIPGALESAWPAVPGKAGSSGIDTKIAGTSSQSTGVSVIDLTLSEEPTPMMPLVKASSSKIKEPLFLPSSSPEPGFLTPSYNPSGKRNEPYVLVPPPPDYLVRYRKRIAKRGHSSGSEVALRRPKRERQRTNSVSMSVAGEEESYYSLESRRDSPADENERVAVQLACSRLQELPCRWNGCDVRLNSVDGLIRHLNQHKPTPSPNNLHFTCRWTQCGRRCTFKEKHLERHALLPLRCAYADCDESFRSGSQLLKHVQAKRGHDRLKPSAEPFVPKLEPPPPIAGVLPAYLLITKLVKPAAISPERHQVLCRLVVRNIVNSDQEKPSRIRARKAARSVNRDALLAGGTSNDYEFMTTRSTRYSSYLSQPVDIPLEDLDSASISEMVDAGFTLWSPKADATDDDGGANLGPHDSPMISPNRTATEIKVEVDAMELDLVPAAVASGSDRHHHEHSSDEDAVAVMLTGMSMD